MSITEAESGLTSQQYTDIQVATGDLAVAVVLQRFGPVWTTHDTEPTRSGSCFDAIIASTYLARVFVGSASDISVDVERLADESGGDQAWASVTCNLNDVDTDVPPSLVSDGLTVRLFYYSTGGVIKYSEIADISAGAFGAAQTVGAVSNVIFLAAVDVDKVHYIVKNSNDNRVLHVYEDTGTWGTTASDVYWPFKIYAFDAVTFEAGKDLLAIATDLAPLIGTRVIGAEVTTKVNEVQAIVHFWVSNGRWSDHAEIDVIDRVETDLSRNHLRMALNNSLLFTSYLRCGGTEAYPYSKAAVARSADGANWEFPEVIETLTSPFVILARTDYLYAVGVDRVLRSPRCAWAGQTPVEYDVTDYILGLDSSAAEIRNSQVQVSNPEDVLAGTLAVSDDRLQVVYELGYVVGSDSLKMQVSLEDVVERAAQENLPKKGIALTTRDFLGRVNRVRSDYAAEWAGMQAGRDTFNDPSETGYGGLRHMAVYKPSWKTPGTPEIHLISKNKEGLAVSTFVTDALNGSAQTGLQVQTTGEGEYAGIAFRTYDKDNLYYLAYYLDDDVIKLVKGAGTDTDDDNERDDTVIDTSASMSWVEDTWYYLKVVVRYSLVYAFYSTDGITWTAMNWTGAGNASPVEMDGQSEWYGDSPVVMSGRFGLIGYGYSDVDTWPPYVPPPWEPPILPPPILKEPDIVYVRRVNSHIYRTGNWPGASPTWVDVSGSLTNINRILVDNDSDRRYIYAQCNNGIWRASVDTSTPVWVRIFNPATDLPASVAAASAQSMAMTLSGCIGIPARAVAACCTNCDAGNNRPVMLILHPDGDLDALPSTWDCGGAVNCCEEAGHASTTYWSPGRPWSKYAMSGKQERLRMALDGRETMSGGCVHTGTASPGDSLYAITNEGKEWFAFSSLVEMGSAVIGVYAPSGSSTIYSYTPGCGAKANWTDITPVGWAYSTDRGLDQDALLGFAVATDTDRLYKSTGGQFVEIANRVDLAAAAFQHCSCYAHDVDQLFLPTADDILWTKNGAATWESKKGDIGYSDYREIRPVWGKEPAE